MNLWGYIIILKSLEWQKLEEIEVDDRQEKWKRIKIKVYKNDSLAKGLFSPWEWFFFGSYFIDEWYKNDLE